MKITSASNQFSILRGFFNRVLRCP